MDYVVTDIGLLQTTMEVDEVEMKLSDKSTVASTSKHKDKLLVSIRMMTVVLSTELIIPNFQLCLLLCSILDGH